MPKIKVEIEVDKDYCEGYFDCPMLDRDKYGVFSCLLFPYSDLSLDKVEHKHKRCAKCKQAEVKDEKEL